MDTDHCRVYSHHRLKACFSSMDQYQKTSVPLGTTIVLHTTPPCSFFTTFTLVSPPISFIARGGILVENSLVSFSSSNMLTLHRFLQNVDLLGNTRYPSLGAKKYRRAAFVEGMENGPKPLGPPAPPTKTPPVWNVLMVSCVPGSPRDWAAMMPTASPRGTRLPSYYQP